MHTTRREFLRSVRMGAAALSLAAGTESSIQAARGTVSTMTKSGRKPNALIFFCDQLRSFDIGCYGSKVVHTPNMDRLAKEGARFDMAITNSPTCVPARSNLLSGQYCRTCVGGRANEITGHVGRQNREKFKDLLLPEILKAEGYRTAEIGKWHIDCRPSLLGFEKSVMLTQIYTKGSMLEDEENEFKVTGFTADYELHRVKQYIKEHRQEPFFLYYNIVAPHMPLLDVPYQYTHMYKPEETPLRRNVCKDGRLPRSEEWYQIYLWENRNKPESPGITGKMPDNFNLHNLTALYNGNVTWADDILGEVLKSLDEEGIADDTLLVLSADHGDLLGSHHLWNKARLYEEAIRIPLIIRWPKGIKAGIENDKQVTTLIDVMPTILELLGLQIPESVQGQSLVPLLEGKRETLDRNYAIVETPYRELGVRTPTHMLGVMIDQEDTKIENERYQFFDLRTDPFEMENLVETNQQAETAAELRKILKEWDQATPRLKGVQYQPWVGPYSNPPNKMCD